MHNLFGKSKIEKRGEKFKVSVYIPQNRTTLSFEAVPINRSMEVSQFFLGELVACDNRFKEYSYAPLDDQVFFNAVKTNKVYGIVDSLDKGGRLSVTILQRCHCDHIDVSIPILFCSINGNTPNTALHEGENERQIVSISIVDNSSVMSIRQLNSKPPVFND